MDGIIGAINIVIEKIYKSVEGGVYETLDRLTSITADVLKEEPLKHILNDENSIAFVATSLSFFYIVQYILAKMISMYNGESPENVFKFILRMVLTIVIASNSKYICEITLEMNDVFTKIITGVGENISKHPISFEGLGEVVTDLEKYMSSDNLGVDGIIKGFISFGTITLVIHYSVRYVTIIFCILVMPLAVMLSITPPTRMVFFSWLKICIVNLSQQWIVKLLLIIALCFKSADSEMFKIVILGTIYLLYKIDAFSKELVGSISFGIKRGG